MPRIALLLIFLALFAGRQWQQTGDWKEPGPDAAEYLTLANNLARYATHSILPGGPGFRVPLTARRPPAYPLLLAGGIRVGPGLMAIRPDLYLRSETQARLWPLRLIQAGLLLLTAFLAMWIAILLTGSRLAGYVVLFAVGLDGSLHALTQRFLSENLATPLFAALTLGALVLVHRGSYLTFGMTGAVLGLLALTRPVYQHFWIPLAGLMVGLSFMKQVPEKRYRRGAVVFFVVSALLTGAWMTRNAVKLGRFFIAQGGGLVLAQRSATNQMDGEEIVTSFLYWTPSPMVRARLLPHWYGAGIVADLDERHEARFREAMARRESMRKEHGWVWGDARLAREARSEILGMPFKHLLVSLPLAWRGMQVESHVLLNLPLFAALFGALILAAVRRDLSGLVAFGPAVLSFALHTLATHNIPRYSVVLTPILWIAFVYLVARLFGRRSLEIPHTAV